MLPYSRVIKGLDSRKVRKKEGLFLIEGPRILEEALAADLVLKAVYADQAKIEANRALLDAASQKTQIFEVPSDEFLQLSDTVTPQGVLAVAQCPEYDLWDLTTEPFSWSWTVFKIRGTWERFFVQPWRRAAEV